MNKERRNRVLNSLLSWMFALLFPYLIPSLSGMVWGASTVVLQCRPYYLSALAKGDYPLHPVNMEVWRLRPDYANEHFGDGMPKEILPVWHNAYDEISACARGIAKVDASLPLEVRQNLLSSHYKELALNARKLLNAEISK